MTPVRSSTRVMFGGVFAAGGVRALAFPGQVMPQNDEFVDRLDQGQADPRWPLEASTLVRLRGAVQLSAGILLASGALRRPAAVVLAASLVPVVAGQTFWACDEPGERRRQRMRFMKDLGLLGGLLLLAVADTERRPGAGLRAGRFLASRRPVREAEQSTHAGQRQP